MLVASKEEVLMNALVLYDSQYGDTERIAQAVADALGEFGEARAARLDPTQPVELQGVDLFILGCPTQGWRPTPTIQSFLEGTSSEELGGLGGACFDTRFRLPRFMTGSAAKVMAAKLREKGVSLLVPPESFFVKGTEGPLRDGELDRAAAWVRMLMKEVDAPSPEARQ
jgi:flavodoxin